MVAPRAQLHIGDTLKTCIAAALCSQRYILNDVLRIHETLGNPLEGGLESPMDNASGVYGNNAKNPSITFSPQTPASSAPDNASDGGGLLDEGQQQQALQGSMQLTEVQQARLRRSICHSLDVASKGELEHRATSTTDLVTSADVMVQHVVEAFLSNDFKRSDGALPFTLVGEEEDEEHTNTGQPSDDPAVLRNANAVAGSLQYRDNMSTQELQLLQAFEHHVQEQQWTDDDLIVSDVSWEALRLRVAIFIDPIDGTNAFVEGELHVPMTLIGIAVDGVPVAGVVNRVFLTDGAGTMNTGSLSIACRSARGSAVTPFVVINGTHIANPVPSTVDGAAVNEVEASRAIAVTYSASTKASILDPALEQLTPILRAPARGAGYKIMMVVDGIAGVSQGSETAEVFMSPNAAIKKWDSCAPHAILAALGGTATDMHGAAITYNVTTSEDGSICRKETISLRTGFVGMCCPAVYSIVQHRFAW